jgi:hypothetical protein
MGYKHTKSGLISQRNTAGIRQFIPDSNKGIKYLEIFIFLEKCRAKAIFYTFTNQRFVKLLGKRYFNQNQP